MGKRKNLKQKWFEDTDIKEIESKVNYFTQNTEWNVVATQTHTLTLDGNIYYQVVVFYEEGD